MNEMKNVQDFILSQVFEKIERANDIERILLALKIRHGIRLD